MMTRNLSDLEILCESLKIDIDYPTKRSGEIKKTKGACINALQNYYIKAEYGILEKSPEALQWVLSLDSVGLCNHFKALTPEMQKELWYNDSWIAQEKMDGVRILFCYSESIGFRCYSRHLSIKNFLPIEYSANILISDDLDKVYHHLNMSGIHSFILDTELISNSDCISTKNGSGGVFTIARLQAVTALLALAPDESIKIQRKHGLTFKSFDCLYFNGKWELNNPLSERLNLTSELTRILKGANINIEALPIFESYQDKKNLWDQIINNKGEGVILKDHHSVYFPSTSRTRSPWVKCKRSMSGSILEMNLGDTLAGYVSGYEEGDPKKGFGGLIGSLFFSTNLIKADGTTVKHEIARISSMSLELRKRMTKCSDGGKVELNPIYYNQVAEIDGQNIGGRSRRLQHAVLKTWRPDLDKNSIFLDENVLNEQIF